MAFSADDKFFGIVIRNGPSESHVFTYDFLVKGKKASTNKFGFVVEKMSFMPRDNQKVLLTGQKLLALFTIQ